MSEVIERGDRNGFIGQLGTRECPKCASTFRVAKSWQVYCSERCRRNFARNQRRKSRAQGPLDPKPCDGCGTIFKPSRKGHRCCSTLCYDKVFRASQPKPVRLTVSGGARSGRRVRCPACRGPHSLADCGSAGKPVVRMFGTVVDGQYVPPEGVKVRYVVIPNTVHGDTVGALLKEAKP